MKQIKYGDSSHTLRCEFDPQWDAENISGVNISIADTGATELVAATAATLYTATTLGSAASAGDAYIELAGGASALEPGDTILIADSDDGPPERMVVSHYDSSNLYAYGERELGMSHSSGSAVVGLWATYAIDVSTVATYTKGKLLVATWAPDTDDIAYTEQYQIAGTASAAPGFWQDLEAVYPSVYEMATASNLDTLESHCRGRFSHEFKSRGMNTERIVDQSRLSDGFILFARWVILSRDGDALASDAKEDWADWFKILCDDPVWQDTDQDGALDDPEEETHGFVELMRHI